MLPGSSTGVLSGSAEVGLDDAAANDVLEAAAAASPVSSCPWPRTVSVTGVVDKDAGAGNEGAAEAESLAANATESAVVAT